jgi:hypothetical protein
MVCSTAVAPHFSPDEILQLLLFPTDSTLKKFMLFRAPFAGRLLLASTFA